MNIHGWKTKTGAVICVIASGVHYFYPHEGISLFMLGVALSFYGFYYRLKKNTKKPMLRSGQ